MINENIRLENISKSFDGAFVIRDYSLEIPRGGVTVIMGRSGCGKTTLARIILGLEKPDAGSLQGTENESFSCVFQEDRLCMGFSAADNVALVLPKHKWAGVNKALEELELSAADISKPCADLSGGQKRRVALARAMEAETSIVVLDEPFKGLDGQTRESALRYIKKRQAGRTLVVITHDREEADMLGGKLVEMKPLQS